MYNLEMVKRLERDAIGKSFLHALQSPVSELVQHFKAWPSQCVFVLDGLYVSIPAFKASLQQFLPYAQRTYLMLHYLESMNTYYAAQAKAALWAGEQLWLQSRAGDYRSQPATAGVPRTAGHRQREDCRRFPGDRTRCQRVVYRIPRYGLKTTR